MPNRDLLLTSALLGFLAVGIGAFGAHGLKTVLTDNQLPLERLDTFKTGVSYQFYHTLAMLATLCLPQLPDKWKRTATMLFITGVVLFSGSLYLLAIREMQPIPTFILGPATPVGGLFFMAGWVALGIGIWKS